MRQNGYTTNVRRLASYVALLLLLTAAVPAFTCTTGTTSTSEERACCKSMQGQCGEMAKMVCCRTQVRAAHLPELAVTTYVADMRSVVLAQMALQAPALPAFASRIARTPEEYPPPGLVIARSIILRV